MRVIGIPILVECARKHADVRGSLNGWHADVVKANWETSFDIKAQYATVSIIGGGCVVFNIKGNRYRIVAKVNYHMDLVQVLFAGTHAEYDRI
ncbi:MAG: type II toxin-antitoxin system HigB family toxin, partial [Anaerolineae bacterium]|nr:type II toxin-antitoxin system HigB family toxin [Anaerolineae bacterium]